MTTETTTSSPEQDTKRDWKFVALMGVAALGTAALCGTTENLSVFIPILIATGIAYTLALNQARKIPSLN